MSARMEQSPALNGLREQLANKLNYEELMNCMRCGFCQPSCPTYQQTGLEAASPRGRIALMKAVADGLMEPDESFQKQMNLCLGCRACEPVCPSDVKYGQLLEQTKEVLFEQEKHDSSPGSAPLSEPAAHSGLRFKPTAKQLHKLVKPIFQQHNRLRMMSTLLEGYQRSGLQQLAAKHKLLRWLPEHVQTMERVIPQADSQGVVKKAGGTFFPAEGERIGTVGLFRGCIMDVLFTDTNVNTVRLLTASGYDVAIPDTQVCCGALFSHSGDRNSAAQLAKQNIVAFAEAKVDFIALNAGGCGAMLVEYDHLFTTEPEWLEPATQFTLQIKDISELLLQSQRWNGILDTVSLTATEQEQVIETVTYQDSCHQRNVMRASQGPRQLLRLLPNVKYVELEGAEICCGSAGIYNLTQPQMANAILDSKMESVKATAASVVLTSNPGCLLQMKAGVEREQASDRLRVMHVVDYMAEQVLKQ